MMGKYNEHKKNYISDYKRKNVKRIAFEVPIGYYNSVLKPIIDTSGLSINAYIKQALSEKIARDCPFKQKYLIHATGYDLFATYDGTVAKWKTVDSSAGLDSVTDDSGWDSETVDNFDEFFGIGNGSEILAETAF